MMVFRLKPSYLQVWSAGNLRQWLYTRVLAYTFGATEEELSEYLKKRHNLTLHEACRKIIYDLSFTYNDDGDAIATIQKRDTDDLAKIITYGTGTICGSRILRDCLSTY